MTRLLICLGAAFWLTAAASAPPVGLYLGYFEEDALAAPDEPRLGAAYLRLRAGRFDGGLLYAIHGCRAGADQLRVAGRRVGADLAGELAGELDRAPFAGSFTGRIGNGAVQGSYASAAGPLAPGCGYRVAPLGRWRLWPLNQGSLPVWLESDRLRWQAAPAARHYRLQLFEADCLRRGGAIGPCLRSDDDHERPSIQLGRYRAVVRASEDYVATVLALDGQSRVIGFGSRLFNPAGRAGFAFAPADATVEDAAPLRRLPVGGRAQE